MRHSRTFLWLTGAILGIIALAGLTMAQWEQAVLEPVSVGTEDDHLGDCALAIDDFGDLHLLYVRYPAVNQHDFYYVTKPNGGVWSTPVPVVDPAANPSGPYLAVCKPTGEPYVVYLQDGALKLAVEIEGTWQYYDLPTTGAGAIYDPALAVDADGNAHVAVIGTPGGTFKMCYGYWDGPVSNTFHFQILENSQLGDFGSGADPTICVRPGGSVAISYRGGNYLTYQADAAENDAFGGTTWTILTIDLAGYQCYSPSIQCTPGYDLYVAFQGNMGFMFPNHVYYSEKPVWAAYWSSPVEIDGAYTGADAKLAVEDDGTAHVVFMETSGNIYTGNFVYTTNQSGSWVAEYLLQGNKYAPTLVMDQEGNGSLAFQEEIAYTDNDVYYYGYVAPIGPPPMVDITVTPLNPPIQIPPEGGTFSFDMEVTNNGVLPVLFDVWTDVVTPGGGTIPLLTMLDIALTPGASRTRTFNQNVPDRAPAGMYTYRGFAGSYFYQTVADADSFEFEKQIEGDGLFSIEDWICAESFDNAIPQATELVSAHPNPFNPETTLRYDVAERVHIELAVFDLQGRKVSTLVDHFEETGSYAITWSGANHPAGVYFARLIVGDVAPQVTKLILLK